MHTTSDPYLRLAIIIAIGVNIVQVGCGRATASVDKYDNATGTSLVEEADRLSWAADYEHSLEFYAHARHRFAASGDTIGVVRAEIGMAVQLRELGQYDSSFVTLVNAGTRTHDLRISRGSLDMDILQERGSTLIRMSRYPEAAELFEDLVDRRLAARPIDSTDVGRAYHGRGWAYHEMQRPNEAIRSFELAISWYDSSPFGQFELSRSYNSMGATYAETAEHADAIQYFTMSHDLRERLLPRGHPQNAVPLANLAREYGAIGQRNRGVDAYMKAVNMFEQSLGTMHPQVAISYGNLGTMYEEMGELGSAELYQRRALEIRKVILPQNHKHLIYSYISLGRILYRQKRNLEAREWHSQAEKALDALKPAMWRMQIDNSLLGARIYNDLGNHDSAIELVTSAATLSRQHADSSDQYFTIEIALEELSISRKNTLQPIEPIQKLCRNARQLLDPGHWIHEKCALVHARLLGRRGDIENEASYLVSLIGSSDSLGSASFEFERRQIRVQTLVELARLSAPVPQLRLLQEANRLIAAQRKKIGDKRSKLILVGDNVPTYSATLSVARRLFQETNDEAFKVDAFEAAEQGRTGVLMDELAESTARSYASIPDSLLTLERDLRYQLNKPPHTGEVDDTRSADTFEANRAYEKLIAEFERNYPQYYNLKYNASVASIKDVQAVLSPSEVLLEYSIADSLYIFAVSSDSSSLVVASQADSLDGAVTNMLRSIDDQDYQPFVTASTQLHQILIEPVRDFIGSRDLVIVPDGTLNYIPFEALITTQTPLDSVNNYSQLPYLLRDRAVSYSYSATLLTQLRTTTKSPAPKDFIGVAPVFENESVTNRRSYEFVDANLDRVNRQEVRTYLPGSLDEVVEIRRAFNRSYSFSDRLFSNRSKLVLNSDASEVSIKTIGIDQYKYVHFATHAFANDLTPEKSGLVLASTTKSGEDGVLSLDEVYDLRLNANLVVLSACETALGKLEAGEGMIGLTRGFLYAGSRNVLVSLWKADDDATRNLMIALYRGMIGGLSQSEALRRAKLEAIGSSRFRARPLFWAQFILHGG